MRAAPGKTSGAIVLCFGLIKKHNVYCLMKLFALYTEAINVFLHSVQTNPVLEMYFQRRECMPQVRSPEDHSVACTPAILDVMPAGA